MAYSLTVFNPAMTTRGTLRPWLLDQERSVFRDSTHSEALNRWFEEMREVFPALNGRFRESQAEESRQVDYELGDECITVGTSWSQAEIVFRTASRLAERHRLGLFDHDASGDVWLPSGAGALENAGKPFEGSIEEPPLPGPTLHVADLDETLSRLRSVRRGSTELAWVSAEAAPDGGISVLFRIIQWGEEGIESIVEEVWPLVSAARRAEPARVLHCLEALNERLATRLDPENAFEICRLDPLATGARSLEGFRKIFEDMLP